MVTTAITAVEQLIASLIERREGCKNVSLFPLNPSLHVFLGFSKGFRYELLASMTAARRMLLY
jgi:hypothetical protein